VEDGQDFEVIFTVTRTRKTGKISPKIPQIPADVAPPSADQFSLRNSCLKAVFGEIHLFLRYPCVLKENRNFSQL
jgi:hypothetical protein